MIYSRLERFKIFPIQKVDKIEAREVKLFFKLIQSIVRDKSRALCELLSDPQKLQEEREFARKTRDKFHGISSTSSEPASSGSQNYNSNFPAAPASGKYGGFGSEDIDKLGYNAGKFNQVYDPYTKGHSVPTKPETETIKKTEKVLFKDKESPKNKKKNKKKKKDDSSDSSNSDSDDSSSDDSDDDKKDEKKKKNGEKMQPPSKAERSIQGGQ